MIRPSMLPLSQYCGHAAELSERYPEASVAALAGDDFHKRAADVVIGAKQDPQITPMVATFPARAATQSELPAVLADPETGEVITKGTADVVLTHDDNSLTVIDWKTGNPDRVDPPDENLQFLAYGLALALERKAPMFRVGVYFTRFPPLRLSRWFHDGSDYWPLLERIRAAATADRGKPIVGPHCDKCFSRKHCSAWMLPAVASETALAPIAEGGEGLTVANVERALQAYLAMRDVVDVAEGRLKDFARQNGGIKSGTKVWGPTMSNGRRSISVERAEAAGLLEQLQAAGAVNEARPYERFSWRNANSKKQERFEAAEGGALAATK